MSCCRLGGLMLAALTCLPMACDQSEEGSDVLLDNPAIQAGLRVFRDQVRADIEDNPVIARHIGDIQSFEIDQDASAAEPGENDFVFTIKGSNGEGVLTATCITIDDDTEDVTAGTLVLDSGETFKLFSE